MNPKSIEKTAEITPDPDSGLVLKHKLRRIDDRPEEILNSGAAIVFVFLEIGGDNGALFFSRMTTESSNVNRFGNLSRRLLSVGQLPGKPFLVGDF